MNRLQRITLSALVLVAGCAPAFAQESETILEESFDVGAPAELEVDVHDADIVLREGPAGTIHVRVVVSSDDMAWARDRAERMDFRAEIDDGRVRLTSEEVRGDWSGWRGRRFRVVAEITAPEAMNVDAITRDGDVEVGRLSGSIRLRSQDGDLVADRLAGSVELHTQDGDIRAHAIDADRVELVTQDGDVRIGTLTAADVRLHSSDGDLVVGSADVTRAEARTSDGDIDLRGVTGEVEVSTQDGDIRLEFARAGATRASTGDGDIALLLPSAAGVELELRGEHTSLRGAEGFSGSATRRRVRGELNGGGPLVSARSGDGEVSVRVRDGGDRP